MPREFTYTKDRQLRITRMLHDRYGYYVEMKLANSDGCWDWLADFHWYTLTDWRVTKGALTEDEQWEIAGLCREEYLARPINER